MALVDELIQQFQENQALANEANEKRYVEAMSIYDDIIQQYSPGGGFGQSIEASLARQKDRSVAQGTQDLTSSGLFGTSIKAGLGSKFEEEVAAPTRLKAQDIAYERLAQAQQGKAGFIERREDTGGDFATMAQLAMGIGAGEQADKDRAFAREQATADREFSASQSAADRAFSESQRAGSARTSATSSGQSAGTRPTAFVSQFDSAKQTGTSGTYSGRSYGSTTDFVNRAKGAVNVGGNKWAVLSKGKSNLEGPTRAAAIDSDIETTPSYSQDFVGPLPGGATREQSQPSWMTSAYSKYGI